ncbi:MAG: hypothetical protein Q8S33_25200 [Myxococcales bacterium]|nr:hypothetical protein [Myxococcales bacterium]
MESFDPAELASQLNTLRERVARLEAEKTARRSKRSVIVAAVIVVATGTALAADGNCPNGLPFCFAPDAPAEAAQVNHNFSQLREWLVAKVGLPTSAGITTSSVSATGTLSGTRANFSPCGANQCLSGNNAAGNFHIDTNTPGGATYLNYFSGTQGTVFGAGTSTEVGRIDTRGFVAGGRRTPSTVVSTNCATANCSATCPSGTVIKMAFGLHGLSVNGTSGAWLCGGGLQWAGSCIGNSSCSIVTGCGNSGLYLECW